MLFRTHTRPLVYTFGRSTAEKACKGTAFF